MVYNRKDPNFTNPDGFRNRDLSIQIYDEPNDNYAYIDYGMCSKYSSLFDRNGNVRDMPQGNVYKNGDVKYDPFTTKKSSKNASTKPIELIGQMEVGSQNGIEWSKRISYISKTMNNHFLRDDTPLKNEYLHKFRMMFDYLESKEYDQGWIKDLQEMNFDIYSVGNNDPSLKDSVYKRKPFFRVKQKFDSGSYKLPQKKIGFGLSSYWGVKAISKMDPTLLDSDNDKICVGIAREYIKYFDLHTESLRKQLKDCELLKNYEKFCPALFEFPKPEHVVFINGFNNTTDFLWYLWSPFSDVKTKDKVATDNVSLKKFLKHVTTNSSLVNKKKGDYASSKGVLGNLNKGIESGDFYKYLESSGKKTFTGDIKLSTRLQEFGYINSDALTFVDKRGGGGGGNIEKAEFFGQIMELEDKAVNVYTPSLLWYYLSPQVSSFGEEITLSDYLSKTGVDKTTYASDIRSLGTEYTIYRNARKLGEMLNTGETEWAQTTLVMNPKLKRSIGEKGSDNVRGTKYTLNSNGTHLDEVSDDRFGQTSDGFEQQNCKNFAVNFDNPNPTWQYHVWYMGLCAFKSLYTGKDVQTYGNSTKTSFGSLSYDNIMDVGIGSDKTPEISGGVLMNIADSFKYESNMFTKANISLLCLTKLTRDTMIGMVNEHACPPVVYLILRPYMEYRTMPIMFIGRNSVFRVRGKPIFTFGTGSVSQIIRFRYAHSFGVIVTNPENIWNQDHAIVVDSLGGSGSMFFNPHRFEVLGKAYFDPNENVFGENGNCSLFSVPVPLGTRVPTFVDQTGHYQKLIRFRKNVEFFQKCPPHFPTAYRHCNFWKIVINNNTNYEPPNSMCYQGQTIYRNFDGNWKDKEASQTPWTDAATGPGSRAYRSGRDVQPNLTKVL